MLTYIQSKVYMTSQTSNVQFSISSKQLNKMSWKSR